MHETLDEDAGERRLPAAGRPGHEEIGAAHGQRDGCAVVLDAHGDAPRPKRFLAGEQPGVDEFPHAGPIRGAGHEVGLGDQRRDRVAHRHREAGEAEEGVVVLGVADADRIVRGHAEAAERLLEPALLRDGRRQHHDGLAIEDDLQLEPEVVDRAQDRRVVRHHRRDDDAPRREGHARPLERGEKGRRGRRREVVHPLGARLVEHGAVLRDDPVEEVELGTHDEQVVEPPSGDEDDPTPRMANAAERREGLRRDAAVGGERPVVVAGDHVVPHRSRRYRGSRESGRGRHRSESRLREEAACLLSRARGLAHRT